MADRILVYGVTGSGKSTLARLVADRTGLPYHSVDDLTWEASWVMVPDDEQRRRLTALCAGQRWVIDAAYSKWADVALARVDLIVALDYPRWLSLSRLVRRTLLRILDKQAICNGNVETWRETFKRDSIIVWHFQSFARKRSRMRGWAASPPPGIEVVRLTSPRATRRWLATVSRRQQPEVAQP